MLVELGNDHPIDYIDGEATPGPYPVVAYLSIPDYRKGRLIGIDQNPGESYEDFLIRDAEHVTASEQGQPFVITMDPADPDERLASNPVTAHIAAALAGVPDGAATATVRRALLAQQMAEVPGGGLPDHEAFVAVASPDGFWRKISAAGTKPTWVRVADHPVLEAMLADFYGCPVGAPDDLEDLYGTRYGSSHYPPGAAPDPLSGLEMLHTTYGRLNQALVMGGFGYLGAVGTATAATATTLTGSAETGVSHAANDCAGQWLVVGPNSAGTGSKVYGLVVSNTSGTTPVYTVDRWYNPATPGGSAGTTPNATSFYSVVNGGPPSTFVALSSNTTAKALAGAGGTADAATISQTLTSEFTTASSGLLRQIAPIGNSGATWTATPVFTATATDNGIGAQTVGTAALSPSMVATVGALTYMTLVSPTATLTATGDQLTATWTITMT